ncbi:MAG: cytochrome c [Acidobacteria bacterium]|nr:cytochrome c [Acidobacteriota bacterium]
MRVVRFVSLTALTWLLAVSFSVVPSAQTPKTDEDYDKLMKAMGATSGSLRKNLAANATDAVAADAKKLVELAKGNVEFWKARKTADATEWATSSLTHATAIEKAVAGKDVAAANENVKLLMGTCGSCHTKYRDKAADGTYIIKKT